MIVVLPARSREIPGTRLHRLAVVMRWPLGLARVSRRYLWRTTPVHRIETAGDERDLPEPMPAEVAVFEKIRGEPGALRVGDEFLIRMPGPWDGPVRVIAQEPASFRPATLRGHLEAGQIEFRCRREGDGLLFEIESWPGSGDPLSHLHYKRLGLGKEIQLNLWVETCLRLARDTGGRPRGGVRVETRRLPEALTPSPRVGA